MFRWKYTNWDIKDFSLEELKQCANLVSTIYTSTRRSKRKINTVNVTIDEI